MRSASFCLPIRVCCVLWLMPAVRHASVAGAASTPSYCGHLFLIAISIDAY